MASPRILASRRRSRSAQLAAILLLLLGVTGCSIAGVQWHDTRRIPGYVVPARIPLVVDTSERAVEADHGGYVDTMVLTVREELGERGVESAIISPKPSRPPSPRVELIVRTFDDGDAEEAVLSQAAVNVALAPVAPGLGVPLAGYAELVVVCRAYSPSNELMFEGMITSSTTGTGNPRDMAELAGFTIAKGLTDAESTRPRARARPAGYGN